MSHIDPDQPPPRVQFTLKTILELIAGIAILLALQLTAGRFWLVASIPVLFAAFAALNFHATDAETDRALKRWMTTLTILSAMAALAYRYFSQ